MAFPVTGTQLTNLVDPAVYAAMVDAKLTDNIAFGAITDIDNTLVATPGSTINVPVFSYIGDANVLNEAADLTVSQLTCTATPHKVVKWAQGVQLTDEAVLSGLGDPIGESARQIALSIAGGIDNSELAIIQAITGTMADSWAAATLMDDFADSLALFGEDINEGNRFLYVSPNNYAVLRKTTGWIPNTDIGADAYIRGVVGMVQGCRVIVTNKLADTEAIVAKAGAMRLFLKRDTIIESARDIINFSTVITGSKHGVPVLYDPSKVIYATIS